MSKEPLDEVRMKLAGPAGARASERYRDLVSSLGAEMRNVYGWKAKAARHLGVHPSYLGKVFTGDVTSIGPEIIIRAIERAGIPAAYFLDEKPQEIRSIVAPAPVTPQDLIASDVEMYVRWADALQGHLKRFREADAAGDQTGASLAMADVARQILAGPAAEPALRLLTTLDPAEHKELVQQLAVEAPRVAQQVRAWEVAGSIWGYPAASDSTW